MLHFLYPSDPLHTKRPDEFYATEYSAILDAGFGVSLFSLEAFQAGNFRVSPALPATNVVYRGWMLSETDYRALMAAIRQAGATPLTDTDAYLSTHHLPNWYPALTEFTPETRIYPAASNLATELSALQWPAYFVKDYVKSLKTSIGSRITTPELATALVAEMRRYRGSIEGGFCVRRVEEFLPETEQRFFVVDSIPYSATNEIPPIVLECAQRIQSRFFSVDIVRRADGAMRVVEVGDGQVSDLVGWTVEQFVAIFESNTVNQQ